MFAGCTPRSPKCRLCNRVFDRSQYGCDVCVFLLMLTNALRAESSISFNRSLIRTRGLFMGEEHKGKGVHIALGPMMNLG